MPSLSSAQFVLLSSSQRRKQPPVPAWLDQKGVDRRTQTSRGGVGDGFGRVRSAKLLVSLDRSDVVREMWKIIRKKGPFPPENSPAGQAGVWGPHLGDLGRSVGPYVGK